MCGPMKEDYMSKFSSLAPLGAIALCGALVLAAAAPAAAQVALQGRPGAAAAGSVRAVPLRPEVRRVPVRPDRPDRRDRRDQPQYPHLQERLRNACFNSPTPPVQMCRRYFGEGGPGAGRP
jgi:hypothetical protein